MNGSGNKMLFHMNGGGNKMLFRMNGGGNKMLLSFQVSSSFKMTGGISTVFDMAGEKQ